MTVNGKIKFAVVGCGHIGKRHAAMIANNSEADLVALADVRETVAKDVASYKVPFFASLTDLLTSETPFDVLCVATPNGLHEEQALQALQAGKNVLIEKPMVMTAAEAHSLIETRDRTGRLLVVAFQGSLSPQVRLASRLLQANEFGRILTISGLVWQNWGPWTVNTWRQEPALSGGGFLFDTGAHLLNTVADLAGENFIEVAAWFVHNSRPVETLAVAMGRLASGGLVTFHACGEAIPSCASEIRVFCEKGILHTGVWGETLAVQYTGDQPPIPIPVPPSLGVWEQFLAVRSGEITNPSPPEVGLRMAKLWDAIRASAAKNGMPVKCE